MKWKGNVTEVGVFVVVVIRFELGIAEQRIVDHDFDVFDELAGVQPHLLDVVR